MSIHDVVANAKPDYVFHLAAQSFPRTSFDAPLDTMDTNVQGTVRVLDALKQHAPKAVIHVCASSEVFGRVPKEKLPIDEECTFHPASPYAISKVGTDLVGRFYAEAYGMTVMTTRMFTHTGPRRGDVFAESTFAKQIAMIEHNLHPAGGQGRQPAIAAHRRRRARRGARLLHAGHGQSDRRRLLQYRRHALLHGGRHPRHADLLLAAQERHQVEVDPDRLRPIDADLQVPNTAKFEAHTGWKPEIPYETDPARPARLLARAHRQRKATAS